LRAVGVSDDRGADQILCVCREVCQDMSGAARVSRDGPSYLLFFGAAELLQGLARTASVKSDGALKMHLGYLSELPKKALWASLVLGDEGLDLYGGMGARSDQEAKGYSVLR
jgi:hypothetical protein